MCIIVLRCGTSCTDAGLHAQTQATPAPRTLSAFRPVTGGRRIKKQLKDYISLTLSFLLRFYLAILYTDILLLFPRSSLLMGADADSTAAINAPFAVSIRRLTLRPF